MEKNISTKCVSIKKQMVKEDKIVSNYVIEDDRNDI